MNFKEYIEFTRTCVKYDPSVEFNYLVSGLISEVGEVAGVYAKYLRGDYSESEYLERLEKEVGDVLWMYARLTDVTKVSDYVDVDKFFTDKVNIYSTYTQGKNISSVCLDTLANFRKLLFTAESSKYAIIMDLYVYILSLINLSSTTLEGTISKNVTKLQERLYKNTIKGDGEQR